MGTKECFGELNKEKTMKNDTIYKVTYEEKISGISEWLQDEIQVLCNGDASRAVEKARKWCIGRGVDDYDPDTEKEISRKCTGFRLMGVKYIARADI
jgi:hypothetical protein